jgi:hypothetical protein
LALVLTALAVACGRPGDSLVLVDHDQTASGGVVGSGGATASGGATSGGSGGLGGEVSTGGGDTGGGSNTGGETGTGGGTSDEGNTLILLIERSSSMAAGWVALSETTPRWTLVGDALFASGGPVAAHESELSIGFVGFTATGDSCPNADVVELAAAKNNAAGLSAAYQATMPLTTPKGESSVAEGVDHARTVLSGVSGKKNILLVTDGEPDTCDLPAFDPQCGHDAAIKAIQSAKSAGITVTVVGVGSGDSSPSWYLQAIANAGAGQNVAELTDETYQSACGAMVGTPTAAYESSGGTAEYYQAASEGELAGALTDAIDAIAAQ